MTEITRLPSPQNLHRAGHWSGACDLVTLTYDDCFLLRKILPVAQRHFAP